jgi:hypothetical protein
LAKRSADTIADQTVRAVLDGIRRRPQG